MFFLSDMLNKKLNLPKPGEALPGRDRAIPTAARHFVSQRPLKGPYPEGLETAYFGMGCFWGAERLFWQTDGRLGHRGRLCRRPDPQPDLSGDLHRADRPCRDRLVVFDPAVVSYADLLKIFWEAHDPTQGMRQGNDVGTTYRSAIYTTSDGQALMAAASRDAYGAELRKAGRGKITTEIAPAPDLLFRRGGPPAISGQEPLRLLRPQGHRHRLRRSASRRRLSGTVLPCRGVSRTAFPKGQNSS